MLTIGDYSILILLALVFQKVPEGILFLLVYSSIRSQAGGYHANTKIACLFEFVVAFIICLMIPEYLHLSGGMYIITCIAVWLTVTILSPVQSIDVPICESQRSKMRKRSMLLLSFCTTVNTILYVADCKMYMYILLATVWLAIVLVAGKIKLYWRKCNG